jgi:tetratricopeptide (TPR) repeat protein
LLLALAVCGCATPQADALRARVPAGLAPERLIEQTPFFPQERYQCGPATLAMAVAASGLTVEPDRLTDMVYVPARRGSLQPEMLAAARRLGRLAVALPPRLEAVLREVDGGTPVIVLQNLGLTWFPVWHYALVIGYDFGRDRVVLNSGLQARTPMSLELFEHTWERGGSWAMVAVAPGRLPLTPSAEAIVEAAAALERVDPAAARPAYRALTEREPELYAAWIGLGNTAMAAGDAEPAVTAFERATRLQPQQGDAWNNLAAALLADRRTPDARLAVRRALDLGGPHRSIYEQTAADIERAQP